MISMNETYKVKINQNLLIKSFTLNKGDMLYVDGVLKSNPRLKLKNLRFEVSQYPSDFDDNNSSNSNTFMNFDVKQVFDYNVNDLSCAYVNEQDEVKNVFLLINVGANRILNNGEVVNNCFDDDVSFSYYIGVLNNLKNKVNAIHNINNLHNEIKDVHMKQYIKESKIVDNEIFDIDLSISYKIERQIQQEPTQQEPTQEQPGQQTQ